MSNRILVKYGNVYYETDFLLNGSKIESSPISTKKQLSRVQALGRKYISPSKLKRLMQNGNGSMTGNNGLPVAVHQAETATGGLRLARQETPAVVGNLKQFSITLTNTDPDNARILFLGDHHGFGWDASGVPALNAVVVVDGTFQALTLAKLKQLTGATAIDFHQLHLQSYEITQTGANPAANGGQGQAGTINTTTANGKFFDSGYFKLVEADVTDEANKTSIQPLTMDVGNNSFQTHIRANPKFRFLMDGLMSWEVKLPPLTKITITSYIRSAERTHGMNLV